jgi:hypothetical protein
MIAGLKASPFIFTAGGSPGRVTRADLLRQQTLLDAAGTIKHQPYTVPAQFGPGTRAAMSSKLFPELVLGHVFHPLPLNKSALVTRPGDPPAVKWAELRGDSVRLMLDGSRGIKQCLLLLKEGFESYLVDQRRASKVV